MQMASQKRLEGALILWLLSFGLFFIWSVYVVASPERFGSASSQVTGFENPYVAATNRNSISQSQ
jgi:hypothetical protein